MKSIRIGSCNRCGECCRSLAIWKNLSDVERALIRIADQNSAEILSKNDGIICKNLVVKNGIAGCSIYENRPKFCRLFPLNSDNTIEECSFRFIEVRDRGEKK